MVGVFITFEGPEGSGKTTQAQALATSLKEKGYPVCSVREPGGTRLGDLIREIVLDPKNTEMLPATEVLLFSAARAQIVGEVIRPKLERGEIVICDRYADSTLAYQGYGHKIDLPGLNAITRFATGGLKPDLTFYLDLPVEIGLKRKMLQEWNRLDAKELNFHRRVQEGYGELIRAEPGRWRVIDAKRSLAEIQAEIEDITLSLLEERGLATKR